MPINMYKVVSSKPKRILYSLALSPIAKLINSFHRSSYDRLSGLAVLPHVPQVPQAPPSDSSLTVPLPPIPLSPTNQPRVSSALCSLTPSHIQTHMLIHIQRIQRLHLCFRQLKVVHLGIRDDAFGRIGFRKGDESADWSVRCSTVQFVLNN